MAGKVSSALAARRRLRAFVSRLALTTTSTFCPRSAPSLPPPPPKKKESALTALLYDPNKPAGSRITPLATSRISRHYHSVAMLLPSGDVWVAGSEQGEG